MVKELKQLEKMIANRFMEDGLWDMYIGVMAVSFGVTILSGLSYLTGIVAAIGFALHSYWKSRITYPRVGLIQLKHRKKRSVISIVSGVFLFGLLTFTMVTLNTENTLTVFLQDNLLLFIAMIWGGTVIIAGMTFNVTRFYVYGVVLFFSVFLSDLIGDLGLNLIISGTLVFISGLIVMLHFIRKYPVVKMRD